MVSDDAEIEEEEESPEDEDESKENEEDDDEIICLDQRASSSREFGKDFIF